MYVRSITMQGDPGAMDGVIGYIRDEGMPAAQGLDGFVGASMLCDRDSGRCVVTTSWENEEALHASADRMGPARARAAELLGASLPTVEEWEVVAMHRMRETPEGGCARLIWARGEQGQLDRIVEAWRTTIPPQLEQVPGFCAVSALANRDTLRAVAAVSYESRAAMDASADQALVLRDRFAATMGFEITDVEEYDVVLAHLRIPELA